VTPFDLRSQPQPQLQQLLPLLTRLPLLPLLLRLQQPRVTNNNSRQARTPGEREGEERSLRNREQQVLLSKKLEVKVQKVQLWMPARWKRRKRRK
jgi:hypothetical protein